MSTQNNSTNHLSTRGRSTTSLNATHPSVTNTNQQEECPRHLNPVCCVHFATMSEEAVTHNKPSHDNTLPSSKAHVYCHAHRMLQNTHQRRNCCCCTGPGDKNTPRFARRSSAATERPLKHNATRIAQQHNTSEWVEKHRQ